MKPKGEGVSFLLTLKRRPPLTPSNESVSYVKNTGYPKKPIGERKNRPKPVVPGGFLFDPWPYVKRQSGQNISARRRDQLFDHSVRKELRWLATW